MKKRQHGFSLIELLIVVAIILIISAIAIPNLLRSKMAANESSAISSLRTLNTAEINYAALYPTVGYSPDIGSLGGLPTTCNGGTASPAAACIVDDVLAKATTIASAKSGYYFTYGGLFTFGAVTTAYSIVGSPVSPGSTGQRSFYTDHTGVIRYDQSATPTSASSPIQ
ncbi:MAG TPA: prepilin-type N-terminal cleavage/methylation domain-containing protein [Candidatus Saccharimonadales bacterium]|nr:prepilin-type N-terminal cleavage/methylation domain-containing protein [Candidatus Saccharimonadales bacterium]